MAGGDLNMLLALLLINRIIIGLTLAVNDQFVILFIVIIFHRKFDSQVSFSLNHSAPLLNISHTHPAPIPLPLPPPLSLSLVILCSLYTLHHNSSPLIKTEMFEGLGLGSRLAVLRLPAGYGWIRYATAVLYCICTPIGMAAGLGAISSFNGNSAEASLATGVLDAFSAGILLYTGEFARTGYRKRTTKKGQGGGAGIDG